LGREPWCQGCVRHCAVVGPAVSHLCPHRAFVRRGCHDIKGSLQRKQEGNQRM